MFRTYIIFLLFLSLIPVFSNSKEKKFGINHDASQNIKVKKSIRHVDDLLKRIESAEKQLKAQELKLQNIQDKIIERRLKNTP